MKKRVHNEYFMDLVKKKCPNCEEKGKRAKGNQVYCWFEYFNGKRRTVLHFCKECYDLRVLDKLQAHMDTCGCEFNLVWKGTGNKLPEFMTKGEVK